MRDGHAEPPGSGAAPARRTRSVIARDPRMRITGESRELRDRLKRQHAADADDQQRPRRAGSAVDEPRGHVQARRARGRASTTARPRPVSVAARPTLNATIRSSPSADLVLGDGAEQDDQRGRARDQAGRRAHREQPAPRELLGRAWCVAVLVVVRRGRGRGRDGRGDGAAAVLPRRRRERSTRRADAEHEQARDEVQPRIEVLRQHVLRQRERRRAPSANTPIVCVTVTVAPSATAWRAVPRVPTR